MTGRSELVFYIAVATGMALGTSAFTMIGGLLALQSPAVAVMALLAAALVCVCISLSVAELASMFPSAPAIRTYFKAAFGNRVSLFLIYFYIVFLVVIAGVESYVFALVATTLLPQVPPLVVVLALLTTVVAINLVGLQLPRTAQVLTAAGCIAIIVSLSVGALVATAPETVTLPSAPINWSSVPAAIGLAVFLFVGFEWVTPLGLDADAYRYKIPLSMPIAIVLLALSYALFVFAAGATLPAAALAEHPTPQVVFFSHAFGSVGIAMAALLSLFAIFSTFNAGVMGGARLIAALARERLLPQWCAAVSLRTGAPIGAVLTLGALASVSALIVVSFELELLAAMTGASIICLIYAGYMAAVVTLRRRSGHRSPSFRSPLPAALQLVLAAALVVLGLSSVAGQPQIGWAPALGLAVAAAIASIAAQCSLRQAGAARVI